MICPYLLRSYKDARDETMMNRFGLFFHMLLLIALVLMPACEREDGVERPQAAKKAPSKSGLKASKEKEVRVKLSEEDKQYLIGVARKAFDLWVTEKKRHVPENPPKHLDGMKSNLIFATIYKDGDWRGCVSGRGKNILSAVVSAVINTCRDRRFKNPEPDEIDGFRVELSVLQPKELIDSKDPKVIESELEPGVHGIYVVNKDGRRAFFLPYVFVKKQRTTPAWLARLSKKAGLPKDGWKGPDAEVYRYGTINFIEETPKGPAVDLYRYKVELDGVPKGAVKEAINAANKYFLSHKVISEKNDNRFYPGLDGKGKPIINDSTKLQIFAATALGYAADLKKDLKLGKELRWAMVGIDKAIASDDKKGLVFKEGEKEDLEGALLLAGLVGQVGAVKGRKAMAPRLMKRLQSLLGKGKAIKEKGEYLDDLPGFAVYATAWLAKFTKEKAHRAFAKEVFETYWKPGGTWSLPAISSLALALDDPDMAKKAIEEAGHLMSNQYNRGNAPFSDYIGAFKGEDLPTTAGVAVRLRGLAMVYELALGRDTDIRKRILSSIMFATRWLLEQQFTKTSAFYLKNYRQYVGSFKKNILVNASRLDDTSLAQMALLDVNHYVGSDLDAEFEAGGEVLKK